MTSRARAASALDDEDKPAKRRRIGSLRVVLAITLAASVVVSGCARVVNPATGEAEFTSMTIEDEQKAGAQAHPQVLKRYGGAYDNRTILSYFNNLGSKLAATSELPNQKWTFTVLDDPIVNAFALPGGYVYVSRGLMALANSEAELAGVTGHEIGHVTARHGAKGATRQQIAGVGAGVLAVLGGIGAAALGIDPNAGMRLGGQLGQVAGQGFVAQYSQAQELEADSLGIRYLARAGFDPFAQADFLATMQAQTALQSKLAGREYDPNTVDFFASHPATAQRVRDAITAAKASGVPFNPDAPRGRDRYLRLIDGMVYGDSPEEGFVRGRTFAHPSLRFQFDFPRGYRIQNAPTRVSAAGPEGQAIIFDTDKRTGQSMDAYIASTWLPAAVKGANQNGLRNVQRIEVNGLPGASAAFRGRTQSGEAELRFIAIDGGDRVYRFLGAYPAQMSQAMESPMRSTASSFRKLSQREAQALRPLRIRVVEVQRGDTVARLASRMAFNDRKEERFRVLNGLAPNEGLRAGDLMKIVAE